MDKDVLVVGARGVLGTFLIRAFEDAGWSVRRGGRKGTEVHVDLDSASSVEAALAGHRLVVNAVPHCGLLAERSVLECGGRLINVSALPAAAARSLRAIAGGAEGTVLMNTGLAPGVTNLVAAELLDQYRDADELEIVFTLSGASPHGRARTDFVHRGLTGTASHRTAVIPLPWPFGERRCLGFAESEVGWLGRMAEGRVVRLYICVAEVQIHERLLRLNDAGRLDPLPRAMFRSRPLRDGTAEAEPVAHWVAAKRGGRRLGTRTIECRGGFLHAARSTVAFAEVLLERGPLPGCFYPEEICRLDELERRLHPAGVMVVDRAG